MRESSYSTLRLGLYEPFKLFFGGVDVNHTDLKPQVTNRNYVLYLTLGIMPFNTYIEHTTVIGRNMTVAHRYSV